MKRIFFAVFFAVIAVPSFGRAEPVDSSSGVESITADELRRLQIGGGSFLLFDARDKKNYESGHIQGAVLPLPDEYYRRQQLYRSGLSPSQPDTDAYLSQEMRKYPKDRLVVAYCNHGCQASANLLMEVRKLGFGNLRDMSEGFQAWEEKGYPVVVGAPRLSSEALGALS